MGALHRGHLSLIERARAENDRVVVSIFVNPLQFGPNEDLLSYPRTLEQDCQLCEEAGVDAIFAPNEKTVGIDENRNPTLVVPPAEMTAVLCGRTRTHHFQGVATIVTKLLNLVRPHRAYFGQKDAQQLAIIRRLVRDLYLDTEIVGCPIVREESGLAMSSRNEYLTPLEREKAAVLYRGLQRARKQFEQGERDREALISTFTATVSVIEDVQLEYVDLVDPQTLDSLQAIAGEGLLSVAARVGSTRLIDNMVLRDRQPIIAIDGPAGAGKSTIARKVADSLGLLYLDTGAMYRAVTWLVQQEGVSLEDEPAIVELVDECQIELAAPATVLSSLGNSSTELPGPQVSINGKNVTHEIRSREVTADVSAIARLAVVRQKLVEQQQSWGQQGGLVAEGRDIGTHVFPDAELKIFLTASVEERARRRQEDYKARNTGVESSPIPTTEELEQDIRQRDYTDSHREIAPLQKSPEAIEIQTDSLSIEEVTEKILSLYQKSHLSSASSV